MTEQEQQAISTATDNYHRSWARWRHEHPHVTLADLKQQDRLLQSSREGNGCRTWNQWRNEHPDVTINLRGADLSGVNLTDANLSKAYLTGVNMVNAKLVRADLRRARMEVVLIDGSTVMHHPYLNDVISGIWLACGKELPARVGPRIVLGALGPDLDDDEAM